MKGKSKFFNVFLWGILVLVCFPLVAGAYVEKVIIDPDHYFTSGKININLSYNGLDIEPSGESCVFRGTITNQSTVLKAVDIIVRAVDASENLLWRHTISVPAISSESSYQFEEDVPNCPDTVPYRLKFEVTP